MKCYLKIQFSNSSLHEIVEEAINSLFARLQGARLPEQNLLTPRSEVSAFQLRNISGIVNHAPV